MRSSSGAGVRLTTVTRDRDQLLRQQNTAETDADDEISRTRAAELAAGFRPNQLRMSVGCQDRLTHLDQMTRGHDPSAQ